ncbi:hypothetical protein PLICRDRAFT_57804 [Plicaturopsis crispa FD-325 SS-3]|uniref:Uncharacterized protein n=1 Tax=Plicaturopsis crispa FD-325 SS-3 TaxID=944288 RepID=A0A0C9SKV7_PLICR|nr:hypothetical protein PLICRDRAFT_57804 [Plicaturopsis crispa FD-325 SS-3]
MDSTPVPLQLAETYVQCQSTYRVEDATLFYCCNPGQSSGAYYDFLISVLRDRHARRTKLQGIPDTQRPRFIGKGRRKVKNLKETNFFDWWHHRYLQVIVPQMGDQARTMHIYFTSSTERNSMGASMAEMLFYRRGLRAPDEVIMQRTTGCGRETLPLFYLQILWPGYAEWVGVCRPLKRSLTRLEIGYAISKIFNDFIEDKSRRPVREPFSKWRVGPDGYHIDVMRLVSLHSVGADCWQAEVAVVEYGVPSGR